MDPKELIAFLGELERLKCNTRHSWTSTGRHETVAAHSWRLATIALLLRHEVEDIDMDRVIAMCLVHDFGEAITGDIPSFEKGEKDERIEAEAVEKLLQGLSEPVRGDLAALFEEMDARQTREARFFRALDKLEAVLQHNEAPLSSWLPLEYSLQQTYGVEEAKEFPYVKRLREQIRRDTITKTAAEDGEVPELAE